MSSGHKTTVFTTNYCASCQTLKRWLDEQQVSYQTVNLDNQPGRQAEILKKTGQLQVPVVTILQPDGDETVVVGNQFSQIRRALGLAGDERK